MIKNRIIVGLTSLLGLCVYFYYEKPSINVATEVISKKVSQNDSKVNSVQADERLAEIRAQSKKSTEAMFYKFDHNGFVSSQQAADMRALSQKDVPHYETVEFGPVKQ